MAKGKTEARSTDQLNESEFGHLESEKYLYEQRYIPVQHFEDDENVPYRVILSTYLMYFILILIGKMTDFFASIFDKDYQQWLLPHDGYAPLVTKFDSFYTRRLKDRLGDCFSRPTTGVPGRLIKVMMRRFAERRVFAQLEVTGEVRDCINLSSYNYLGFAQSVGQCTDAAEEAIYERGLIAGGTRFNGGCSDMHEETEKIVAQFVGKEVAMLYSMGYATNANFFASIADRHCLVLSDELNHASIRTGLRVAGAVVKVFKHNNMKNLEEMIREHIAQGQPKTHRPWLKIFVVVEGLYSMEGTLCNLPELIKLREKYGIYLFVDEAHSIGAMGPHGRGVCDYFGVDTKNVDILMGTFTKSFGATGGYIAGSKELIERLKVANMANVYAEAPTPPVLAQIQASLKTLMGEINPGEARERLQRLAFNTRYFRLGLLRMGFVVSGHIDSPVIPLMLYHPSKMLAASRLLLKKNVAVVLVGYPATPLLSSRIRFCMSSALKKSDLDYCLQKVQEVGDEIWLRISQQTGKDGKRLRKSFEEAQVGLVEAALDPETNLEFI
ncbi:Serine palmitoyltransferase 2 [Wickerhamiella sorbophila]|uniref:Serine palmitoyltransferase 2 n=1 Tax=Wickerhamiella sorbophila TaxID=45607 RepID=A0A2T0FBJ1_9ASCO|nr:Serine palmitoyltransferase 2 [Wickerhamiella sorbophila]PRT52382.1 Serine palmitoyltransferase 2 [Wickerhamiella sorbophila]